MTQFSVVVREAHAIPILPPNLQSSGAGSLKKERLEEIVGEAAELLECAQTSPSAAANNAKRSRRRKRSKAEADSLSQQTPVEGEEEALKEGAESQKERKASDRERPSMPRPDCGHNSWDNVRVIKGQVTLRCRVCQVQWRTHVDAVWRKRKCGFFNSPTGCNLGHACPKLHLHPKKQSLAERYSLHGAQILAQVPAEAIPDGVQACGAATSHAASTDDAETSSGAGEGSSLAAGPIAWNALGRRSCVSNSSAETASVASSDSRRQSSVEQCDHTRWHAQECCESCEADGAFTPLDRTYDSSTQTEELEAEGLVTLPRACTPPPCLVFFDELDYLPNAPALVPARQIRCRSGSCPPSTAPFEFGLLS